MLKNIEFNRKVFFYLINAAGLIALVKADTWLFIFFNSIAQLLPETFWSIITVMGDGTIIFAIFPFVFRKYHKVMLSALFLTILALVVVHGLKNWFDFQRPPAVLSHDDFHWIGKAYMRNSFPSGHSVTAIAAAVLWCSALKESWHKWVIGLAALVCFSRIAVGAHWPTDVLVGAALGFALGWVAVKITSEWSYSDNFYWQLFMLTALLINAILLFDYSHDYPLAGYFTYLVAATSLIATIVQLDILFANKFGYRNITSYLEAVIKRSS